MGELRWILREKVIPDRQPRTAQLKLALGSGEEPKVQVCPTITNAVDVAAGNVRESLDVPGEVRADHAHLRGKIVAEIGEVAVMSWVQTEDEGDATFHACQPPAVV